MLAEMESDEVKKKTDKRERGERKGERERKKKKERERERESRKKNEIFSFFFSGHDLTKLFRGVKFSLP
jgi:hypothetical protein